MKTLREQLAEKSSGKVLIHWIVADDSGPIISEPMHGVSLGGRYRVACDASLPLGKEHRGSGEPHAVTCEECVKHPQFAESYRPAPNVRRYEQIPGEHRKAIEEMEMRLKAKGR